MIVNQIVDQLSSFAESYHIKSMFVVGDYCNKLYFDHNLEVNTIEISCVFEDQISELVDILASEVFKAKPIYLSSTKTAYLKVEDIVLEFQTGSKERYMQNDEIKQWLTNNNIEDTNLNNNIYGREFTINSLAYSPYNRNLYDPTKQGITDIDRKKIYSLLHPSLLLKYHPLSCFSAIYYALKYDFRISDELMSAIQAFPLGKVQEHVSVIGIANQVLRLLKLNFEGTIEHLKKSNLAGVLKFPEVLKEIKRRNKN